MTIKVQAFFHRIDNPNSQPISFVHTYQPDFEDAGTGNWNPPPPPPPAPAFRRVNVTKQYDGGTFANQTISQYTPSTTVTVNPTETIGAHTYHFVAWSDGNTDLSRTITAPGEISLSALYKGRLLSSVAEASSQSGSQRRFARDASEPQVFYLVYESAGKIWLTHTTNGGTTWTNERLIDEGARPSLAPTQQGVGVSYIATNGTESEVWVRAFSLNPSTGVLSEAYSVTNLLPCTNSAVPTVVWLGLDNSPIPPFQPRYAVFYETQGAAQNTTQLAMAVIRLKDASNSAEIFTLNNSQASEANLQMYPASDNAIPTTSPAATTVTARLVYRQRSGSEGWLRYQPLTFDFSSPFATTPTQGTAQVLDWVGSGRAEQAGNYPTKPSVEVKNNITYIAFEVEGKNDIRYTTVNSTHQQGAVTVFSQTGEVLRAPSLHLQPSGTAPAIYFNMSGAVYEARWTAQSNWNIQKVASDGVHANIAVRSGNRRFVYTANANAPFRLAFADGTTEGDAANGGIQEERGLSGGGKGNTPTLALNSMGGSSGVGNSGGGTSPSVEFTTLERTTGVLSNQTETASLALTLSDVGLNGSSRAGLTYHELGANLLPDTLALSPISVFSLLKSRRFNLNSLNSLLADSVNQISAVV
ncbi:MAG: hypothetical protein SNJ55_13585, partial [Chloroherpetonaceae bacterium]